MSASDSSTGVSRRESRPHTDTPSETKHSLKTTEFIVMIAVVAGVLIAAAMDDSLDAERAWILVSAIAIGYMLSRGLAKSGSRHWDDD